MLFREFSACECFIYVFPVILTIVINYTIPVLGNDHCEGSIVKRSVDDDYMDDPDISSPHECFRKCVKGEPPKICYYHFTLELYTVNGGACSICTPNKNNSESCQCVLADGYDRGTLTVNRKLPGPSIRVCAGDKVVIDVQNKIEGNEITIHWHGILQKGTQYYDGVPMVTQCAIPQGTTFRYRWKASSGSHFWHAHTGLQKQDGVFGGLIVRTPPEDDPNFHKCDYDQASKEILISDYLHVYSSEVYPGLNHDRTGVNYDNLLINGKGQYIDPNTGDKTKTSLESFRVTFGKKYRFRLMNAFAGICQGRLTVQNHTLTLIATDGQPLKPFDVDAIVSMTGETYDFIIHANQPVDAYWIQLIGTGPGCSNTKVQQLAILRYGSGPCLPSSPEPTYDEPLPIKITVNPVNGACNETNPDFICINQLESAEKVDADILKKEPDEKHYFTLGFVRQPPEEVFAPGTYERYTTISNDGGGRNALLNNISFIAPPSPPLSQIDDIPSKMFCNITHKPENCGSPCFCTHKVDICLDAIVELIIIDGGNNQGIQHPFHLHGYVFFVVGMGPFPNGINSTGITSKEVEDLDRKGLLRRELDCPPGKDTIQIPRGGYAIVRFKANNPGYWFFHCHIAFHLVTGMAAIIHVGEKSDLPAVPKGFPKCGDYLPPIKPFSEKDDW